MEGIQRTTCIFYWALAFQIEDINEKTKLLTETLVNIFRELIPNKTSKIEYKKPVWMNNETTTYLKRRSKLAMKHFSNPEDHNKNLLVNTATEYSKFITAAKEKSLS